MSEFPLLKAAGLLTKQFKHSDSSLTLIPAKDVEAYLQARKLADGYAVCLSHIGGKPVLDMDEQDYEFPKGKPMPKENISNLICDFFKPEHFEVTTIRGSQYVREAMGCTESAITANRLLQERGTVVYGRNVDKYGLAFEEYRLKDKDIGQQTHQALLINIKPIEKEDTAEGLLRDIINYCEPTGDSRDQDLFKRAKKLLEKKNE